MPSGNTVNTTIDYNLQMTAHEALGDNYGAVIVTEVKTGRVLVLLSHPTFDPNNIAENWESLVGNEDDGAYEPCDPGSIPSGIRI